MTNYEHYKDKIEKITRLGYEIAVNKHDNKPCVCDDLSCDDCIASTTTCFETISKWADEEYIEPGVDWSKVPVDTPILVSDDEKHWHRRYFAKRSDGKFYTFSDGSTSWSAEVGHVTSWLYAKLAGAENNESEQNL